MRLWVYDLESCLVRVEKPATARDFLTDESGCFFLDHDGVPAQVEVERCAQVPNFVAYRNVFDPTATMKTSSLTVFVREMLTDNDGKNLCLAHNASGYDTRLVFEEIARIAGPGTEIKPILRGGKFMRLAVGKTVFQDTMLHLIGSLKKLACDFIPPSSTGPQLAKG